MLNLANKITLVRMGMTPVIVALLYNEGPLFCLIATGAFVFASLTDFIDGYIARRENMITSFGKFLDPLADKVLICSVLIMFVELNWVPGWLVIIIICRELLVTGLRAMAADEGIVIAADRYGKAKTVLQIFAIVPLMIHYPIMGIDPQLPGKLLLYIALALTVFSGSKYIYDFYRNSFTGQKKHD